MFKKVLPIHTTLLTTYRVNKSYKGFSITKVLNQDTYDAYMNGLEYCLALYKIELDVKYTKTYRYEIGSIWKKSIRENVEQKSEKATIAYIIVPVRTDLDYSSSNYLFNNYDISKKVF